MNSRSSVCEMFAQKASTDPGGILANRIVLALDILDRIPITLQTYHNILRHSEYSFHKRKKNSKSINLRFYRKRHRLHFSLSATYPPQRILTVDGRHRIRIWNRRIGNFVGVKIFRYMCPFLIAEV